MTPYSLARMECASHTDGECIMAQDPEPMDYSLPLPEWLPAGQWAALVAAARRDGEKSVSVRVRQTDGGPDVRRLTAADLREHAGLPTAQRIALGRRHDLFFCPRCGVRVGGVDTLCGNCPMASESPGGRPPSISQAMAENPQAPLCTICGRPEPNCGAGAEAVVCTRCTYSAAMRAGPGARAGQTTCRIKLGERCTHFERSVLPLADKPSPKADPGLQAKRLAAREKYLMALPPEQTPKAAVSGQLRRCPDCGEPMGTRRRYCPKCARRRRQAATRKSVRRNRAKVGVGL